MSKNWLPAEADPLKNKYEPLHFIRAHCQEKDMNESTTQIWDVVFNPENKDVVTTCGGRYLCVFNVSTGELLLKYTHKSLNYEFYSLSWTLIDTEKVLASGSACGEVRLFNPEREVSFYNWNQKKGVAVNSVQFHSTEPSWLFTATSESVVSLWALKHFDPPHYSKVKHVHLLKMVANMGDVYSMAWVGEKHWLMVGTMKGLVGWNIKERKVKENKFPRHKPTMVEFSLPGVSVSTPYVDSVCSLGDGLVATKCVGMGKIFVFRADFVDVTKETSNKTMYQDVEVLAVFCWHKTDNFYMNIGGSVKHDLMLCGDDQGRTWVYKLPTWLKDSDRENSYDLDEKILPLGHLLWPDLGKHAASGQTMLDKVAVSPCGLYLVAVTNTNIVAIWKKELI